MKKGILIALLVLISVSSYSFWGFGRRGSGYQRGGYSRFEESKDVLNYLDILREKYDVKDSEELYANKLKDLELEKLGELLMASHAIDKEQLQFMKSRMGGQGSKDLNDAYRFMASNYLSGYGMMGYSRSKTWGNRGGFFGGGFCFGRGRRGFRDGDYYGDSPLDVLKRRFANGEISEKEYNEMKEILEK